MYFKPLIVPLSTCQNKNLDLNNQADLPVR